MSKSLTASKRVMKNYLSELLTDTDEIVEKPSIQQAQPVDVKPTKLKEPVAKKSLQTLLSTVKAEQSVDKPVKPVAPVKTPEPVVEAITTRKSRAESEKAQAKEKSYRKGNFQAMFFDVAGLTIAVPLIELGGIHKVHKTTSLMGKPDWFKGVMLHREDKINVVDTAMWVMPEKCDEALKNSLNYQYIIMLNKSSWGLMAEHLVDTVTLSQDEVKWLDSSSKRPWLAGLVKEKMCALLDVNALIQLLDDGSGINQGE